MLFSDIDKTLAHKERAGIEIPTEGKFISERTIDLMREINNKIPVAIITGRSLTSYKRVSDIIPHSIAMIEHGCLILEGKAFDSGWVEIMKPYIGMPDPGNRDGLIWEYDRKLQNDGIVTYSKNRMASFSIREKNNPGIDLKKLAEQPHPEWIKTTWNQGYLDFIPAIAGKKECVEYLLNKNKINWQDIGAFGDDLNDLELLRRVRYAFTLTGASEEVIELVKGCGYVSPFSCHAGTEDVLSNILNNLAS
jgi:hydroxymethylpyrimidine pyrophosphatase-like HAD family hydrolase